MNRSLQPRWRPDAHWRFPQQRPASPRSMEVIDKMEDDPDDPKPQYATFMTWKQDHHLQFVEADSTNQYYNMKKWRFCVESQQWKDRQDKKAAKKIDTPIHEVWQPGMALKKQMKKTIQQNKLKAIKIRNRLKAIKQSSKIDENEKCRPGTPLSKITRLQIERNRIAAVARRRARSELQLLQRERLS